MINIFLCDYDPDMLKKEIKYIENLCEKMEYEFLVEGFSDTKIALQKMREAQDFCDILITDIEMPELSGLEMAKMLRAEKKDFLLIFITEHTEYVFEALEYMPFRFIRKERMEKELPAAIQAACEKVAKDGDFPVLINTSDQTEMLRAGDILYYALENRKCMIYTMRGEYEVWKTIRDMRKELGSYDESFLQIYRGCMVNKKYIRTIKNETVILENGTELPFSRRKRKEISDRMMRYWGRMV